jgi:GDP-4-dehydro-6-deoxy-D-mannose reductase
VTTCLITGVGGFCGPHVAARLRREQGLRIVGSGLRGAPPAAPLDDYFRLDVCDRAAVDAAVRQVKPDWVVHLAGRREGTDAEVHRVNEKGGANLIEAVRQQAPRARLLLIGTAAEYGLVREDESPIGEDHPCMPAGAYAQSKHAMVLAGLEAARTHGMKIVIARPFNAVGPGLPPTLVLGAVLQQVRRIVHEGAEPVVKVGNIETQRDFVDVGDLAEAYVRLLRGDRWGGVFNLCSGRPVAVRTAIELLLSHAPRPIRLQADPSRLRGADVKAIYGNGDKARRAFDFSPATSLETSIRGMWDHAMKEAA